VLPRNTPALVEATLQLLQLTGQEAFWWTPNSQGAARGFASLHPTTNPSSSSSSSETGAISEAAAASADSVLRLPLSSRDVLAWLVDLSAVPPLRVVAGLAAECPCPPEAAQLQRLATEEVYKEQVSLMMIASVLCCSDICGSWQSRQLSCSGWPHRRCTKSR
jgi:hypothetical protein